MKDLGKFLSGEELPDGWISGIQPHQKNPRAL
jgi:hypothetical protein